MDSQTRKYGAEFLGTLALVLIGAGAVIVESHTGMSHLGKPDGKVGLIGIALAHGLTLAGSIFALGSISGGHFNPAVSFAVWMRGKLDGASLLGYVLAQLGGAVVAAACLAAIFPDEIELAALGTPMLAPKITLLKGLVLEAIITFFLVAVVLFVTRDDNETNQFTGIAVGGTLVGLILFAGPLTGAGANPARFLGPALISSNLAELVVYVVGPLLGGAAAALVFQLLGEPAGAPEEPEEPEAFEDKAKTRSPRSPDARIQQARELFRIGRGEEAAAVLLPLVMRFDELGQDAVDSVRTLLMVIDEEHGHLEMLDKYRHLIDPNDPALQHP